MSPIKLSSANYKVPKCTFNPPGETRKKFKYYADTNSTKSWSNDIESYNTDSSNPTVSLYGFRNWECTVGGLRYTLKENDPLRINSFNMDSIPVIEMRAYWDRAYDVISFNVDGDKYCEVCIDTKVNRVVYPEHDPVISDGDWKFYGWDCAEGDYLPGVDRSSMVICGENETPIFCEDGPIVCKEDDIDYSAPINAYLVNHASQKFKVTFKYVGENGQYAEREEEVVQNHHLPRFHIHNQYVKSGSTFTFRHWLLKSGNLTSSLTVLQDLVFVAVYDETKIANTGDVDSDSTGQGQAESDETQTSGGTLNSCTYCKSYSDEHGHTHGHYCSLVGLDSRRYGNTFEEFNQCPYVKVILSLYGA